MEAKNDKVVVFSVVRDQDMYLRCLLGNNFLKGCVLKEVDNAADNQPVTKRYNDFLDSLEEDCWVVLCHEDWEVKERLYDVVKNFDPAYLYGPIGVFVEERETVDVIVPMGYVSQSTKNDRKEIVIRGKEFEGRVDTFDCQCLIFHSSIVREHGLRFDEHLSFDMYVEDFCACAYERAGIQSRTVKLESLHHSFGKLSASFKDSLDYVRKKYAVSRKRYATIVGHLNTFGGDSRKPVFKWKRIPWVLLRYKFAK